VKTSASGGRLCRNLSAGSVPRACVRLYGSTRASNCYDAADLPHCYPEFLNVAGLLDRNVDGDQVPALFDNCPAVSNFALWRDRPGGSRSTDYTFGYQFDQNADGIGDACQDTDGDVLLDGADNCPNTANASQVDRDSDGIGDACDSTPDGIDADGDGLPALLDNCQWFANPDQKDADGDGEGDICDLTARGDDQDNDGVPRLDDNCPAIQNRLQFDNDKDGIGNECDSSPNGNPAGGGGGAGGGAARKATVITIDNAFTSDQAKAQAKKRGSRAPACRKRCHPARAGRFTVVSGKLRPYNDRSPADRTVTAIITVDPAGAKKIKSLRIRTLASSKDKPTVGVFTFKLSAAQMAGGKIKRIVLGTLAGVVYKAGSLTLTWKKGW
jgi:hypothetical protein